MKIRRLLFRLVVRGLEALHRLHGLDGCDKINFIEHSSEGGDLVTIAFNNCKIIEYQIKYIRKHIKDCYTYIVADNSSDDEAARQIRSLCDREDVAYVRLPKNYLGLVGPSYSHAAALNWVCEKIIRKRKPLYFGFIDHDLFPVRDVKIADYLVSQPLFGAKRERGAEWYLSAIMSFFRYDFVKDKKLDFMPVMPNENYLDTGGGNWYSIYSKMDPSSLTFVSEYVEDFREGGQRHQDQVEIFDKRWLHTINGSYWKKVENKDDKIEPLIEKYGRELNS